MAQFLRRDFELSRGFALCHSSCQPLCIFEDTCHIWNSVYGIQLTCLIFFSLTHNNSSCLWSALIIMLQWMYTICKHIHHLIHLLFQWAHSKCSLLAILKYIHHDIVNHSDTTGQENTVLLCTNTSLCSPPLSVQSWYLFYSVSKQSLFWPVSMYSPGLPVCFILGRH